MGKANWVHARTTKAKSTGHAFRNTVREYGPELAARPKGREIGALRAYGVLYSEILWLGTLDAFACNEAGPLAARTTPCTWRRLRAAIRRRYGNPSMVAIAKRPDGIRIASRVGCEVIWKDFARTMALFLARWTIQYRLAGAPFASQPTSHNVTLSRRSIKERVQHVLVPWLQPINPGTRQRGSQPGHVRCDV